MFPVENIYLQICYPSLLALLVIPCLVLPLTIYMHCTTVIKHIQYTNVSHSTPPYDTKKPSWDFLRNSCQYVFLQRLLSEIAKKTSWHFFGGHFGPLAAQNPQWPPSDIERP